MKKLLAGLIVFCAFVSHAQNYRLIDPDRESYFQYNYNSQIRIHAIRIDSVNIAGSDTIYNNYKLFGDTYFSGWESCIDTKDTNFFMDKIILNSNGEYITFNKFNDTILIKPSALPGQQWILCNLPGGNYIEATVNSVVQQTVLGNSDSVKTISLQVFNSGGNPIAHDLNWKTIQIAKNYGLIRFYNTYAFPDDTTSFRLAGISNPDEDITNLTHDQIFNWDVGDEFHYYGSWNNGSGDAMYNYELITIINKFVSVTGDTVVYSKERKYYQKSVSFPVFNVSYNINTISDTVISSAFENINNVSHKSFVDSSNSNGLSGFNYQFSDPDFPLKRLKISFPHYHFWGSCFGDAIGWCVYYEFTYLEGVGLFKEDHGGGPDCYVKNLVYYNKGTETWGTPVNWQQLLSVNDEPKEENISIFPNPSHGIFSISTSLNSFRLEITNTIGEIIFQSQQTGSGTKEIDLSAQPKGIYFVKILDGQENFSVTKIIID